MRFTIPVWNQKSSVSLAQIVYPRDSDRVVDLPTIASQVSSGTFTVQVFSGDSLTRVGIIPKVSTVQAPIRNQGFPTPRTLAYADFDATNVVYDVRGAATAVLLPPLASLEFRTMYYGLVYQVSLTATSVSTNVGFGVEISSCRFNHRRAVRRKIGCHGNPPVPHHHRRLSVLTISFGGQPENYLGHVQIRRDPRLVISSTIRSDQADPGRWRWTRIPPWLV